jgi:hypothetical protein
VAWLAVLLFTSTMAAWFGVTQPLLPGSATPRPVPNVDASSLEAHVRRLAVEFVPRDWEHTRQLDLAADYIRDRLAAAGAAVESQRYQAWGRNYRNVIGRFGPQGGERIIVGAHYDAAEEHPGADDNASGVAGLLELARLHSTTDLAARVDLVAYTLEEPRKPGEPGVFRSEVGGSAVHARMLREAGAAVKMVLVFDMIGYFSDEPGSQDLPVAALRPFYPSRGDFIAIVGRLADWALIREVKTAMRSASELPVHSLSAPTFLKGVDWSDHSNYWKRGYPAALITDTSFYRNKHYHTADDTPERLDYRRMSMVVQGAYAAVMELAASDGLR